MVLQDTHNIEQPVGEGEHKYEHRHQGSEDEDSGHGGFGMSRMEGDTSEKTTQQKYLGENKKMYRYEHLLEHTET